MGPSELINLSALLHQIFDHRRLQCQLPFDCHQTGVTPNGTTLGVAACSILDLTKSPTLGLHCKRKCK